LGEQPTELAPAGWLAVDAGAMQSRGGPQVSQASSRSLLSSAEL
jgi:hypothetical protein